MAKVAGIGVPQPAKEWSWSYSKLKNFDVCPKRHYEIDLAKTYAEENVPGGPLDWGNAVHAALAKAISGAAPLPADMATFQTWVDRVKAGPGQLFVEQKYAITRDFQATTYFARNVWYRGIGDVVRIWDDVALILDWKTGKILEDSVQLMLMAQCLFSHFPNVKKVRSEFVWLKEECTTPEVFDRQEVADQWVSLLPRVTALETATKAQAFPPKPSGLCKRHCVVQSCPFHGKGPRG
jgi:hypothetical protein